MLCFRKICTMPTQFKPPRANQAGISANTPKPTQIEQNEGFMRRLMPAGHAHLQIPNTTLTNCIILLLAGKPRLLASACQSRTFLALFGTIQMNPCVVSLICKRKS